jgi:hypothetical protein
MKTILQLEADIKNTELELALTERELEAYFDQGLTGFIPLADLASTHELLTTRLIGLEEQLWELKRQSHDDTLAIEVLIDF